MIPRLRLAALLVIAPLVGCGGGPCQPPAEQSDIPLLRVGNTEIVPVMIDGEPAGLILDTGATVTTLTPQAAASLKIGRFGSNWRTSGVGGDTGLDFAEIPDLRVGGAQISNATVLVTALSRSSLANFPAFGLLGDDLLTNWDLDLDAAHDRLRLYQPQVCADQSPPWPDPARPIEIPRVLTGAAIRSPDISKDFTVSPGQSSTYSGEILFPVTLDGHRLTAMLDTGASRSAVRQDAIGLDDAALQDDPAGHLNGVGLLAVRARLHRFDELEIGGSDLGPMMAAVGPVQLHGADMLLGEDFLRRHRVYIAFHAGKLFIDPAR